MKFKLFFLFTCLSFALVSCEKTITLDLEQTQPKMVIEGFLTFDSVGNPVETYIKLSKSAWFYDKGAKPPVSGASVKVSDGEAEYEFVESPEVKGYYLPKTSMKGKFGRTYQLTVNAEGKTYTAADRLIFSASRINNMESVFDEDLKKELENTDDLTDEEKAEFYRVFLYADVVKNPSERTNFRFKFYKNGIPRNFEGQGVFVADDEFIKENVDGIEFATPYALNDTAKIEIYVISREALVYYMDLSTVLNNDGGMWGPVPANARTNLSGGALGFFQLAQVTTSEIVVK